MFSPDQYDLLDFGEGRRLERFGPIILDRPCPAAEGIARSTPDGRIAADATFHRTDGDKGAWIGDRTLPESWTIAHGRVKLLLKRTDFGHVGVFPEQAANWDWIAEQIARAGTPIRVLNLFAYTGGSTLAAAVAGAEVVHVDSARNIVAWARLNAGLSDLEKAPIRWIPEDAVKFVRRELDRGNRYDAVILDPPSYGHGPRAEIWQLSKDLDLLLRMCAELTAGQRRFMLLSCHTLGFSPDRLREMMNDAFSDAVKGRSTANALTIRARTGGELPCGAVARWEAGV